MISILAFSSIIIQTAYAYDNGAPGSRLPVLGWSSWVALGPGSNHPIFDYCDEFSVTQASDAFVSLGFKDAGYTGFHLDDCWADKNRNESGYLQGELDHFPNGMKPVVDHVHNHGLDFGLYTCVGTHTCVGGRPGSKDHWVQDADVFASWGVDWVKQDNCNTDGMGQPEEYYKHMSDALNKTGRSICFAMCEWGLDDPWTWGYDTAQSWRATGDHTGTWSSTKQIIAESAKIPAEYTGKPFGWNDLDMLETGNYEQAAHANGKESNMTEIEYKTEFTMWAISASPLVVTTPIMNCSAGYVSNKPHQDWAEPLEDSSSSSCTITMKKQFSDSECTLDVSYGCFDGNRTMWTDHGCRGQFVVDGATVLCDTDGEGRHYCGQVKCTPWISELQREILFNQEVIAINQDSTPQGRPIKDDDLTVWSRHLTGGDVAVALYNEDDDMKKLAFDTSEIGFDVSSSSKVCVRDLWAHKDVSDKLSGSTFGPVLVEPHQSLVYRVSAC